MSLALLAPDTPVPGGVAASSTSPSSPSGAPLAEWSGDEVSGSVGLLAGMSPGWDRAELQWEKEESDSLHPYRRIKKIKLNCTAPRTCT